MKRFICALLMFFLFNSEALAIPKKFLFPGPDYKPPCDISKTTICTIEIWLANKHKKLKREIGSAISAEDARLAIDFALKYNDRVDLLVLRPLNPPNYVAIATSAWDEMSQIPITQEDLARLRDPKLTTEEFHSLYYELTNEANVTNKFY